MSRWGFRALLFFGIALLGVAHHYIVSGRLFDWAALWHHEPIILVFVVLALRELFTR